MGANNSSEREEGETSGQDVLDVLQQLAGDLGVRVEMSLEEDEEEVDFGDVGQRAAGGMEDIGVGQRATRTGVGGGGNDDRGEGEVGGTWGTVEAREESGDEEDVETERLATMQLLARLFGAKPSNHKKEECRDPVYPRAQPMTPSCDFYREMVRCSSGLRDPSQTQLRKNLCGKLASRQFQFSGLSDGQRVNLTQHMMPRYPCLVDLYTARVFCGTYNQDGSMFISAVQDNRLYLYESSGPNFEEYKSILGRDIGWSILDVVFSPDQYWFAYSTWSPCVHVCNVYGREEEKHYSLDLRPDTLDRFCVFSLRFSSDGQEIITACSDGYLYVYNREICDRTLKIDAHQDDADAVALDDRSPQIIYSGGDDGLCKVWDRRCFSETNPIPVGTLAGHKDGITFIDTKGDGRYLITNSKDQTIKLWDIRQFSERDAIDATLGEVQRQCWDYRWQDVPKRAQRDALVKLPGDSSVMTYAGHLVKHTLLRARFSPAATTGQRYIYTACAKGRVLVYDALSGEVVETLMTERYRNCVRDVSWNPSHPAELVSSSWDGVLQLWTQHQRPHIVHDNRKRYIFSP